LPAAIGISTTGDKTSGGNRAATERNAACASVRQFRPHYHAGYYAAFVIDPDGNNVEAVFHGDRQLLAT
jgi:hypothetical protein